jgi:hypothetical protein
VEELQQRMSHAEFVEWAAFAESEPLPGRREDLRAGLLMMLLANLFKGKGGPKLKLMNFLPDWWEDRRSPASLAAKFRGLTEGAPSGPSSAPDEEMAPHNGRHSRDSRR